MKCDWDVKSKMWLLILTSTTKTFIYDTHLCLDFALLTSWHLHWHTKLKSSTSVKIHRRFRFTALWMKGRLRVFLHIIEAHAELSSCWSGTFGSCDGSTIFSTIKAPHWCRKFSSASAGCQQPDRPEHLLWVLLSQVTSCPETLENQWWWLMVCSKLSRLLHFSTSSIYKWH